MLMKIKNIYKVFFFLGGVFFILSSSNGPGNVLGGQVTGAPGSFGQGNGQPGTCANAGCHSGGDFAPSIEIELLDGSDVVTAYEPGKTYQVKITGTASTGTPAGYGFQAVTLDANDSQAGDWANLGSDQQQVTLGNRSYAEHSAPSASGTFELEWTAPVSGTGNVTIYAAVNAANGNGNSMGDAIANGDLTIEEMPPSSVLSVDQQLANMKAVPNPVQETLNLQIDSRMSGEHHIRIMDLSGKVVSTAPVSILPGRQTASMDVALLPSGLYVVQLCGDGHLAATQMLKQ